MRDTEKNRDPDKARKRAKNDARTALRKLDLLEELARVVREPDARRREIDAAAFAGNLARALGVFE